MVDLHTFWNELDALPTEETPLTAANEFPMPALVSPAQAASAIVRGWERGDFEIHFPKRFTHVMKLLRLLPYRLYFAAVRRMTGL